MNRKHFEWDEDVDEGRGGFVETAPPKRPRLRINSHTFLWAMVAFLSAQMFQDASQRAEVDWVQILWAVNSFGWLVVGAVNLVKLLFGKRVSE